MTRRNSGALAELVHELEEAFHRVDVKGTGFIDQQLVASNGTGSHPFTIAESSTAAQ